MGLPPAVRCTAAVTGAEADVRAFHGEFLALLRCRSGCVSSCVLWAPVPLDQGYFARSESRGGFEEAPVQGDWVP